MPSGPALASDGQGGKVGTFFNEPISVAGQQRVCRLVVPKTIDPRTPCPLVFAYHGVGMSNGAFFSHILASQRSDKIAAIAVHSGGLGAVDPETASIVHKYPVMIIHGAGDLVVKVDESRKVRDVYQKCGHEVEYLEVPGLHHGWAVMSRVNERIWTFFQNHPRE
jgi:predicted esterase